MFWSLHSETMLSRSRLGSREYFPQRPPNRIPFKFHCPEFGHMPKPEPITCKGNKGGQASSKGKRPLEKHTGLSREGVRMPGGQSIESSVEALSTGLA